MGLSHTFSEVNSDFSRKSQIFQPRPRRVGFPWNWVTPDGLKRLDRRGYQAEEEVSLAV